MVNQVRKAQKSGHETENRLEGGRKWKLEGVGGNASVELMGGEGAVG